MSSAISSPGSGDCAGRHHRGGCDRHLERSNGRTAFAVEFRLRDWAWSPDGTQIVTADDRVWETATGKQVGNVGPGCEPPLGL